MKKFILLLTFVFSIGFIDGQTTFFKTITGIDESSNYIEQTTDGGYVIVGTSMSPADINGYVIKTDASGDTIWTKIYGTQTRFYSGMQTNDGGYIATGTIRNLSMFDYDIFVLKIDPAGVIQWQKIIGLGNDDYGYDIKQTSDTGYVITGTTNSIGAGGSDICVIKLDVYGNLQWTNILGTSDYEDGTSIQELNNGGYILTGTIANSANSAAIVTKLNNIGSALWTKSFSGTTYDRGLDIVQTSDSGFLIAGTSGGSSLIKTDSMGNFSWGKEYVGSLNLSALKRTNDGNYILSAAKMSGSFQSKLLYTLIDSTGNVLWSRFMGYNTFGDMSSGGSYAQQTTDGGYVFGGYSTTPAIRGFIYFIKADSLGRTGCDSTATLAVNSFSPIVTTPLISSGSGLLIATTTYPSSFRADTIITYCTSVGINELPSTPQISVYPNPSSGQFNFNGLEKESKIEVFDITGRIIYQSIASGDFETINISDKAKGIYFYRITKEMRLVQSGKICVE